MWATHQERATGCMVALLSLVLRRSLRRCEAKGAYLDNFLNYGTTNSAPKYIGVAKYTLVPPYTVVAQPVKMLS
jgi:hypothetical protein